MRNISRSTKNSKYKLYKNLPHVLPEYEEKHFGLAWGRFIVDTIDVQERENIQ